MRRFAISVSGLACAILLGVCFAMAPLHAQAPDGAPQTKVADARPGDVRVISSNGIRGVLEAARPKAEKAIGHPLLIQYGASKDLKATIESGQAFEVTIVTPEVLDQIISEGKVVAGSRVDLAKVPAAIAQRGEAPKHDISTREALKKTLLGAKSIRFTPQGASYAAAVKMVNGLGIADAIKPMLNLPPDVKLGPGEYELSISLASEVLQLKDQKDLGPILPQFNVPIVMSAGVGAAGDQKVAKALIQFLKQPSLDPVLKQNAMER